MEERTAEDPHVEERFLGSLWLLKQMKLPQVCVHRWDAGGNGQNGWERGTAGLAR